MDARHESALGAVATTVEIDACRDCSLFWLDAQESLRLTPQSVLDLFRYVGEAGRARNTLAASFGCPRCARPLRYTHDLQRTTRFTYWRCAGGHGRLITFHQFLAEKNFLRPPSATELARLRESVKQVSCSQCGAPIDRRNVSGSPHCGTPVALIDSDSIAKTVQALAGTQAAPPVDADVVRTALSDAQVEALFELERLKTRERGTDLVASVAGGLAAAVALLLAA
jgi:endogenous inhibitor of DNA gyrase (YacG/DUF329 family)